MSKKTKNTVWNTPKNRWAEKSAESSEDGDNDANLLYPDLTGRPLYNDATANGLLNSENHENNKDINFMRIDQLLNYGELGVGIYLASDDKDTQTPPESREATPHS